MISLPALNQPVLSEWHVLLHYISHFHLEMTGLWPVYSRNAFNPFTVTPVDAEFTKGWKYSLRSLLLQATCSPSPFSGFKSPLANVSCCSSEFWDASMSQESSLASSSQKCQSKMSLTLWSLSFTRPKTVTQPCRTPRVLARTSLSAKRSPPGAPTSLARSLSLTSTKWGAQYSQRDFFLSRRKRFLAKIPARSDMWGRACSTVYT